jgi:hypothetical protein
MANEEIKPKDEVVEQDATIIFRIPAYKDKTTNMAFERIVKVPTKKAYAIYCKTIRKYEPDKRVNP